MRFPEYARPLAQYIDKELYNFVSLGVGEGSKDRGVITTVRTVLTHQR